MGSSISLVNIVLSFCFAFSFYLFFALFREKAHDFPFPFGSWIEWRN